MLWVGEWGVGVVCVGLVVGPPTRDSVVVLWTNFLVSFFGPQTDSCDPFDERPEEKKDSIFVLWTNKTGKNRCVPRD